MWIHPRFVSFRDHGLFEPGYGLAPFLLFDQISPDIVVRIAEIGVHANGLQALLDGAFIVAQKRVGPSAEGIGLGGREQFDGARIEFDGLLVFARHLAFIGLAEAVGGIGAWIG